MTLQDTRREYRYGKLDRDTLRDSPFDQFRHWLDQAIEAAIQDPTAMGLTTVDADGKPWSRVVLLKGFDENGFQFYTHLDSRKGRDIEQNPNVSLHFPWLQMDRQIIIGGTAKVLPHDVSRAYFATRPHESQIAAWVATQSAPVASREFLDAQFAEINQRFAGQDVPMPETWGGFCVVPCRWEFWQGGEFRLHDRFTYEQDGQSRWLITRLAP